LPASSKRAAQATGDACFGLHFGEHYNPKNAGPANQYNDENLFIITDPQVAQHFRAEVDRVFTNLAQDFP